MKKYILNPRYFVVFPVLLGLLFMVACEKVETLGEDIEWVSPSDDNGTVQVRYQIPNPPDFGPPNIPQPPLFNAHCVVRLAYLSYLRRCPESAGVVNYWINVLNTQGFDDLAQGFITSHEASVKWNSQYHSYLSRNNVEVHKFIYIAYRGLLLREPDVNGGKYWTTIFYNRGIKAVANGIANSPGFANRLNGIHVECNNAANQCTY